MSLFFFDTSALVKIYHEERGSKACPDLYLGTSTIAVSELARVELYSAVFRKLREREINEGAAGAVLQRFEEDCRTRFEVYHVASLVYEEAVSLLEQYASRMALRTLDALQLATYLTYREREADVFVSSDEQLCQRGRRGRRECPEGLAGAPHRVRLGPAAPHPRRTPHDLRQSARSPITVSAL